MTRPRFNPIVSSSVLIATSAILVGCLEEDEPNSGPAQAWYNPDHPIQWWFGDETLPGPNGHGVLLQPPGSAAASERDSWPIHLTNPDDTYPHITHFEGYIWLNANSDVSVGLMGYRGPDEDGTEIWEWLEPLQHYSCDGNEVICARSIVLPIDHVYNEVSLEFEGTGDYGFFLTPYVE